MTIRRTRPPGAVVLQALYHINSYLPELPNEWLDQVLKVAESGALWFTVAVETGEGQEAWQQGREAAKEYWVDLVGDGDERAWKQIEAVAQILREYDEHPDQLLNYWRS